MWRRRDEGGHRCGCVVGALRPAFAGGRAQEAAWRITAEDDLPRLESVPRESLRAWGVESAGEATIRVVCDSFIRVSPINLVLSGPLRRLLAGERPAETSIPERIWTPPSPLPSLPSLVAVDTLPAAQRDTLLSLATMVDGRPFGPGLYRMLGHWPRFLAHGAGPLRPHLDAPATREAGQRLLERLDGEIPALFATLPPLPAHPPMPAAAEFGGVLAALDAYRKTSPEMVVSSPPDAPRGSSRAQLGHASSIVWIEGSNLSNRDPRGGGALSRTGAPDLPPRRVRPRR